MPESEKGIPHTILPNLHEADNHKQASQTYLAQN